MGALVRLFAASMTISHLVTLDVLYIIHLNVQIECISKSFAVGTLGR